MCNEEVSFAAFKASGITLLDSDGVPFAAGMLSET